MTHETEKQLFTAHENLSHERKWDFLDLIGGNGPWQWRVVFVMLFISIPAASHNLVIPFFAPNLDYWCARPPEVGNVTIQQWKSFGLPREDPKCSRYENISVIMLEENSNTSHKIVPCEVWEYDTSLYTSTILSEWDLVCQHDWLISLSKSVFMAGILTADIVFGHLADRLGRRPVIALSAFTTVFSATICTFSTSFIMFIVSRFFIALGVAGCFNVTFVLMMEVIGPELRSIYGIAVNFGWCIGFVSLPGIVWLLRDWFWIQVALTAPSVMLLGTWWVLPESPRWLLSQGRIEEAHEILICASAANRIKLPDLDNTLRKLLSKASEVHESGETKSSVIDLLRIPGLRQITLNIYFVWFVCSFVYYGLSFNTNELAGDPFINFALSGAVEFPAYFLAIFAIKYLGRKSPLAVSMGVAGLACLLSYPLPLDPWWLSVAVSMIGKFCIAIAFAIIYVYTAELFPTVLRNIGVGSASFCARISSVLAPFIRELGNATHPVVPQIVFGVLAMTSGGLILFLPETNNCIIPDTVKEAVEAAKRRKLKKTKLPEDNVSAAATSAITENITSQNETSDDSNISKIDGKNIELSNIPNGKHETDKNNSNLHLERKLSDTNGVNIKTSAEINFQI